MATRKAKRRNRTGPGRRSDTSIWRGPLPLVGALALVALIIVAFAVLGRRDSGPPPGASAAPAVVAAVTGVPAEVFDAVGTGGLANPLQAQSGAMLRGTSGKPLVVYVGADFCPFCASERWSVIAALSRFGTFDGLQLSRSSSTDVYPNTATFSFRGSSYTSELIEFAPVETADRDGRPQDSPTPLQQQSLQRFDAQGSIPFLSLADQYTQVGSGYPPDVLSGKSWLEVASQLKTPTSPVARAILGNANYLTAALCQITEQKPATVCESEVLRGLAPPR
jgi:hypothetical protein